MCETLGASVKKVEVAVVGEREEVAIDDEAIEDDGLW